MITKRDFILRQLFLCEVCLSVTSISAKYIWTVTTYHTSSSTTLNRTSNKLEARYTLYSITPNIKLKVFKIANPHNTSDSQDSQSGELVTIVGEAQLNVER